MKTKLVLSVMITSLFLFCGCSNNDDGVEESAFASKKSESKGSSVIHQTYKQAQAEVLATFGAIGASIMANNEQGLNDLIGFHDYAGDYGGYYFTEFNYDGNGVGHLFNGEDNEANERAFFGGNEVTHFATVGDPKVAVYYGNVANVTFISDFIVGGHQVDLLITLLFVKTKGEWKLVHEHHSPKEVASTGGGTTSYPSEQADLSSKAQQEVLATFMAIRQTILDNSGTGAENMDELISFHAYGPKFTEFNYDEFGNGYSFNSKDNETNERGFFGDNTVTKFAAKANTLNIVVYHENVANVTFISDFEVVGFDNAINNLITLLFVKTKGEWKLVHEHHSPENH